MTKKTTALPPTKLRQQATAKLSARAKKKAAPTDAQRLIHELEQQNEALLASRRAAEQALQQYTELYDFAPVGYFTLTRNSTIRQVNLTGARLLNIERDELIKRRLSGFVAVSSRADFNASSTARSTLACRSG